MLDILLVSPVPTALAIVGIGWLFADTIVLRHRPVPARLRIRAEQKRHP